MNREIFKIKNNTISDIELKSFGLIISSGQTIELGNFDNAVLSNELYNYIQNGSLVRIINNLPVDSGSSYYQSSESYTSVLNNMIYVSKTGGTFKKIQDAIDSINDATYENRYVISVNVGTYTENIIMKNYVSLKGESNETKIVGNVTFNSLLIGNSEIYNIIIQSTNTPTIYINTISVGYRVYLHDVGLISIWDDDSSIKSVVDIQSGSLNMMSRSILSLTSYDTGSTNNDLSVIYYVHGTSKIELISSYSTNYIYEYNNINVCSLYFNNNINIDFNTSFIKDGSFTMTLCGSLPSNMIKIFNHSGTTSITVADNFYMKLLSNNDISNVIYLPAYNNYSIPHDVSGTTLGSEICLSFCTMTWDQVKIPDNVVYLGVAISEIDYVELMSFIYDTNFDVIPSEYLIDGVSSGLTIDITNSWGSYLNTSSIKTYNIQIGDSGNYVTDIFDDSGLTSNSHYALPTQYSVKSYIDNALLGINTGTTLTKTEFYTYTGETESRIISIESDISGLTENKLDKVIFNNYSGNTGLQEVTNINALTTVESIFNGGIVTNNIRPSGDTTSAIKITSSGGTQIIVLDTISGFTGFGTIPTNKIHLYGIDNDPVGDEYGFHTNSIKIDGVLDGDKDLIWAENGVPQWAQEIYRNEKGKYWYLYQCNSESNQLTVTESGRIGINNRSNFLNKYVSTISGNTLNGVEPSGEYTKNYISVYLVKINSTSGATSTFVWSVSKNFGNTYGNWSSPIECSLSPIIMDSGIELTFIKLSGYTIGDTWRFTAFPQSPLGTFIVTPNMIYKTLKTNNINSDPIDYIDITGDINTSSTDNLKTFLLTGTTDGALYIGGLTKINALSINIITFAIGVTLVTEYWNGSIWVDISIGSDLYNDGTNNLTQIGTINWNTSSMNDWIKSNIPYTTSDEFNMYWIRLRSISPPTVVPIISSLNRNGEYRLATMTSSYDYRPSFYVDTFGRTSIGGGNVTGTNKLQINSTYNTLPLGAVPSLVEIDSEDSTVVDLKIKLSSDDSIGPGFNFSKTRGTLSNPSNIINNDIIGHLSFRTLVNNLGYTLSTISTVYTGNGITKYADIIFKTYNDSNLIERVRISDKGMGFGVTSPSALIHLSSGTTSSNSSPLKFISGDLMDVPEIGSIEFNGNNWYGTIVNDIERKTFAFLESPIFVGTPYLPSGTTFSSSGLLNDFILYSGGTNNISLLKVNTYNNYTGNTDIRLNNIENDINTLSGTTDNKLDSYIFYTYTGNTIPWSQVSKIGSSISDLSTRNSSDITYINTYWDVVDVKTGLDRITDNIENVIGTGRISPIIVLGGLNSKTLWVSGGTGFINYQDYHRIITWSGTSYDITSYSANTYYVYVSNDSVINISSTEPDKNENIYLGQFYYDSWYILTIQQSSYVSDKSISRMTDYTIKIGGFIYDNGGKIQSTGTTQHIVSTPCKVQYGLLDYNLTEIDTYNNTTFNSSGMYLSSDLIFNVDYYYMIGNNGNGKIINNRYNIPTNPSDYKLTGYTLTYTQYSNIVTSDSDLTGLITDDHYIYLDNSAYMTPVSSVTWSGSLTTIVLEDIYLGPSGTGVTSIDKCLPKIPDGKWVKHLVVRTTSDNMATIYGQQYFDTKEDALNGEIPSIPPTLVNISIKMATIVVNSGITDYSQPDVITDIRPLPFTYRNTGGGGGGTSATAHGLLTGLLNDDHPQYLLTNGSRNITGVISYDSSKTISNNNDLVHKKYVDDNVNLKVNITDYDIYTGTTIPNNYYNKSQINTFTGKTQSIYNDTLEPTGFINNDNIVVSYDNINRIITLSALTGNIEYYWRGEKYNLGTSWSSDSHTNNTLSWYLSSSDGINFTWSNTSWSFDHIQVSFIPSNSNFALREVHGTMQYNTHKELHQVVGTYKSSGFGLILGTYEIKPPIPMDIYNTPGFNSGIIVDEDINTTIPTWSEGTYTHLYFIDNGTPIFITGQTTLFRTGTTYPKYNNYTNNIFGETEMDDDYYANWYVIRIPVTIDENSQKYSTVILQPQYQYSTVIAAEGENTQKIELGGLSNMSPEFVLVERITIRTNSTYSTTNKVRIESVGILSTTRFGQVGSTAGVVSVAAENVTVSPLYPFTSLDLQSLSNEYAIAINNRLSISEFNVFTGTTLPTNYYNKSEIGVISGQTYNVISLKSDLISPNFSGTPTSTVAAQDTNTIQIATTSYVVGQASSVNPLMNGTVAIGTSLRYARADHVHPNDTTKLNISDYNIFTGTTLPSNYYNKTQSDLLLNGKSNTGHTHSTIDITNLSIYSGFTNYYIKSETDAQLIKGKIVDDTNINDNRSLVYDSISGKIVYKSVLDTSPTIQARRTSDYTVTTSWTNVLFTQTDVENKPDTLYWDSVNTDRFYVTESGYYSLMFQSKVTCTTTTTQTNVQMLINNTTVIVGSDTYVNVYSGEVHPLISSVVTYLTGGSYIVIQVMRNQTSSTLLANPRFIMYKMDGVVGARGATGSGSNITVQNNGTGIQNTPHSILNFTGNIVSVNDSGSGVATISINQSVYGTEFHYIQDLTTTTTTSVTPTYATKITLTTSTLSGGTYKITATYGVNKNNITTDLLSRVTVDGTMIGNVHNHELSDTATYLYTTRVFFVTLTATTHTILLQFSNETSGTVSARDASLELIRVS